MSSHKKYLRASGVPRAREDGTTDAKKNKRNAGMQENMHR